ncbi:hypothetical protein H0H92_005682 [Tricholoma furcatifolium]|nr:hypothetical protein H0H92_005682 [Tricholoma furcatifolium]
MEEATQSTPLLAYVRSRRSATEDHKGYGELRSSSPSISSIGKSSSRVETRFAHDDDLMDDEPPPFKWSNYLYRRNRNKEFDLDTTATRRSVYDDPVLAKHYWPKPDYEGIHRFDAMARWTLREEKELVTKIDWRVMLWGMYRKPEAP